MEQEIAWLQVTMNHSVSMCIIECGCSLRDVNIRFMEGKHTSPFQHVTQTSAREVRHHQECKAILFPIFIYGHNVDVFEFSNDVSFTSETGKKLFINLTICRYVWKQELNR